MNFLKNEYYVQNIFQIRDNIFNITKFNEKKVKICSICEVVLIPCRYDIIDNNLKDILWYSDEDYKSMRSEYLTEIAIIARMNNISFNDSVKIWKQAAQNNYYSSTYVLLESSSSL